MVSSSYKYFSPFFLLFNCLHSDMVGAIEMIVVTEDMKIVKDPQQNMVQEDTMSFSTDRIIPS